MKLGGLPFKKLYERQEGIIYFVVRPSIVRQSRCPNGNGEFKVKGVHNMAGFLQGF